MQFVGEKKSWQLNFWAYTVIKCYWFFPALCRNRSWEQWSVMFTVIEACLCLFLQAMVGILQGKARGGEEESVLMHDLKPFRILISLLDKPELGTAKRHDVFKCTLDMFVIWRPATQRHCFQISTSVCVHAGPAILEDVLIEVFRTLHTQCRTELDLQNQSPFSKDQTHLSRSGQRINYPPVILMWHIINTWSRQ